MNKIKPLHLAAFLLIAVSSTAQAKKSTNYTVDITLSFKNGAKCMVTSNKGQETEHKGHKTYDEMSAVWSTGCEVHLPKKVKQCVLTSQGLSNQDSMVNYAVQYKKGTIKASMESNADINTTYGRYTASYYCY
jgi:hypothetical protein